MDGDIVFLENRLSELEVKCQMLENTNKALAEENECLKHDISAILTETKTLRSFINIICCIADSIATITPNDKP